MSELSADSIHVHLAPSLAPRSLHGSCCVVIDVLRATTSMIHALANNASAIVPCRTVESARGVARERGHPDRCLLAGERGGVLIPGFDLDNSPHSFSATAVAGREIVFTTTNGTLAIETCESADSVVLAAFSNWPAVIETIARETRIDIVCAATQGEVTREDALLAGRLVWALQDRHPSVRINDSGQIALATWQAIEELTPTVLAETEGGRNLIALGMFDDVEFCACQNTTRVVPYRRHDGAFVISGN